ncbi:response regulator, partial [Candidatus Eisenbacteria bacterium]
MHTFSTARELRRRLEYQQPDLLVLDAGLPRFDGLTALRTLDAGRLGIILLSSDTLTGARVTVEALFAGARDYIIKRGAAPVARLAIKRHRFMRALERAAVEAPALTAENGAWLRLQCSKTGVVAGPVEEYPFVSGQAWIGLVMVRSHTLA